MKQVASHHLKGREQPFDHAPDRAAEAGAGQGRPVVDFVSRSVVAITSLIVFLGVLTTATIIYIDRGRVLSDAAKQDERVAGLLAEHTRTMLRNIGGLLQQIERDARAENLNFDVLSAGEQTRLGAEYGFLISSHPAAESVYVLDSQGRVAASSNPQSTMGLDLSDRAYFQKAMRAPPGTVRVAEPVIARGGSAASTRISLITRPIADAQGRVRAVAVAVLSGDLYRNMERALPEERGGLIGLYLRNGTFIEGVPPPPPDTITVEPAIVEVVGTGTSLIPSGLRLSDGESRTGAVTPVPDFALMVFVGESTDALLAAEWRPRALAAAMLAAFLLVALTVSAAGVILGNRRRIEEVAARHASDHALAERETMMDMIMDTLADGILILDARGRVVRSNRFAGELFGRTQEGLRGQSVGTLIAAAEGPDFERRLASMMRVGGSVAHALSALIKPRGMRADGGEFPAELSVGTWEQDGEMLCTVAVRDRTESDRAERYVRRTGKMDAIGRLAGGVAHDFNNLLGIILGNLDILASDADQRVSGRLAAAQRAASRAAELTKKLLTFSRTHPLAAVVVDLDREVAGAEPLLAQALTGHWQLELRRSKQALPVKVDPGELEDALLNLVLNARDAMEDGGRIVVETSRTWLDADFAEAQNLPAGSYAVLMVSDHGIGMEPDAKERIFEPFFSTKSHGTGLGLSSVYGFVRRSGGTIRVYSEPGLGTTLKIMVPEELGPEDRGSLECKQPEPPEGQGEVVLIVDDESDLRDLADTWLSRRGYVTLTAASAKEAMGILEDTSKRVDVLFTDIVLPGGRNGDELSQAASSIRPDLKIVLTSGFTWAAWNRQRPAGPQPFPMLPKPYGQTDLSKVISDVLKKGDDE